MSGAAIEACAAFIEACDAAGSNPIAQENAVLSVGREFLPPHALAVLDGGIATEEYWVWLRGQTTERERDYAAGHGWDVDQ